MGGFRISGALGGTLMLAVDPGTLVRSWSPFPTPIDFDNTIGKMVQQKLRQVEHAGFEIALKAARRVVIQELRRLKNDLDEQLEYLANLPNELRKDVAYEFFAAFFDQPLPKKMLRRYIFGGGAPLKLSEQEMIDCNPYIDLSRSKKFQASLSAAAKTPGKDTPVSFKMLGYALTNGTLGGFTVNIKGTLVTAKDGSWQVKGTMNFYDKYDFDPRDFATGGRSPQGEIKTRVGHYAIPGNDYEITSVDTKFSQSQADKTVVWAGGEPQIEPDRVASLDAKLAEPDR